MQIPMVLYINMVSFRITAHLCTMRLFTAPLFTFCRIFYGLIMTNYFGILRLSVIPGQHFAESTKETGNSNGRAPKTHESLWTPHPIPSHLIPSAKKDGIPSFFPIFQSRTTAVELCKCSYSTNKQASKQASKQAEGDLLPTFWQQLAIPSHSHLWLSIPLALGAASSAPSSLQIRTYNKHTHPKLERPLATCDSLRSLKTNQGHLTKPNPSNPKPSNPKLSNPKLSQRSRGVTSIAHGISAFSLRSD
jgi:hypothetical protein